MYFVKYITNLGGMFVNTKFRIICEVNNIVRGQISENFNSDKYRSSIVCKFKCRFCEQVQQLKISKCIKIQMYKTRVCRLEYGNCKNCTAGHLHECK
jgi:hypothetical protein